MDVKSTFLNVIFKEEVYVEQPTGYVKESQENKIHRLKKTLYDFKQTPRTWYVQINSAL